MAKGLSEITWEEFAKSDTRKIDTWPYLPSGLLKQREKIARKQLKRS